MWKVKLKELFPFIGHRNWILVVDKAFPMQSAAGMTYLDSAQDHDKVIAKVLHMIDDEPHIKPVIYTDQEYLVLSEMGKKEAKMVDKMERVLRGRPVQSIPHDEIFAKLDAASKLFNVIVIKTESTVAYSSLFIELDCAYWTADKEIRLRELLERQQKTYAYDKNFIEAHHKTVELRQGEKKVLLSPTLQGRVVTSTMGGEADESFGWINYSLIESGVLLPHCNNFGGEDRFWVGPEGGQFSIFFPEGTDFDFEDWQAPKAIDSAEWDCVSQSESEVVFGIDTDFVNTSGKCLSCRLERTVSLLSDEAVNECLGMPLPEGLSCIGFKSDNRLTNNCTFAWTKETGMLSIWTLGQFCPSSDNTILIPYKEVEGEKINDSYFGTIPADRFSCENGMIQFKCDGKLRGKIGTPPLMTIPLAMSLDKEKSLLTIVKFNFDDPSREYVNSMWEHQEEPFKGDVINSYNDGPLEDGTIMGGFYEIETSSPAANLAAGETITHCSTTIHIKGELSALEALLAQLTKA